MMTPLGLFFTALGYGAGALVFYLEARRRGLATAGVRRVAVAGLAGGIVGAKLTQWLLASWLVFTQHPEAILDPANGGRTIIGGIVGGWMAVELAKRWLGIRRSTGDLFAIALAAGEAVGRIGCFFNSCSVGTVSAVPWAVFQQGAWRHPAQLYTSITAAGLLLLLLRLRGALPREGDLFRLYLVLFGLTRFGLEFFRERTIFYGGLSMAQWACLEMVVAGSLLLAGSMRRARALSESPQPA
jgi:phosphatidylglycerol---prolipoprotein diacylglyceryl transferase